MKPLAQNLFLLMILFCSAMTARAQDSNTVNMDAITYPFDTQSVQLSDSISLTYVDEGSGVKTLLFIHGLGSYLPAWQKNITVLRNKYRCIALDLPGYGKSGRGDFAYDMHFFADQVALFMDQLSLKNVTVIGHSMGGQIAMTLALRHPEALEKLVLIAPAGFEQFSDQEKAWFARIYTPELVQATPPPQIERNFALNFHQGIFPDDARFMYRDRLRMRELGPVYQAYCQMIPRCVQGMLNQPVFNQLDQIQHPTLVLYGLGDLLIPNKFLHPDLTTEQVARHGAERLPKATLQLLENCGHFVQWECADRVNESIQTFIANE